jgi:biotin carboxyl carrier protein
MDDVLTYALYPTTGLKFLEIKHGLKPVPEEMKPPILESDTDVSKSAKKGSELSGSTQKKSSRARSFDVHVDGEVFRIEVDPVDLLEKKNQNVAAIDEDKPVPSLQMQTPQGRKESTGETEVTEGTETTILAPMPGIVLRYMVDVGQQVKVGDTVVVLESMKMENSLPSSSTGIVKTLSCTPGTNVVAGDILAIISQ